MRGVYRLAAVALALGAVARAEPVAPAAYASFEIAPVHALDSSPDGERLAVLHGAAGRLLWLRWQDGKLIQEGALAVGLEPVSVRFRGPDEVWVVAQLSDRVAVVDLDAGRIRALLPTADAPADLVFAGNPQRAYLSTLRQPALWRFDPEHLEQPAERIALAMPEPRALAVSGDGARVFALAYRSGNATTVLPGSFVDRQQLARLRNVVGRPEAPYAGRNPPPPTDPSLAPSDEIGKPPAVGLIVQRDADGSWRDDQQTDWSRYVSGDMAAISGRVPGWDVPDRDLAALDTRTGAVQYTPGLITHGLALAASGAGVELVGMQAFNRTRFEPRLRGRFIEHHWVQLKALDAPARSLNLNPPAADAAMAASSVADVRALLIDPASGTRYLAAQGSDRILRLDRDGKRLRPALIEVPPGPSALALGPGGKRLVVWSRFASTLSVIDTQSLAVVQTLKFAEPAPPAVVAGRPWLYDARRSSASGTLSCASCHLDARHDRLAWDLGDPGGQRQPFAGNCLTSSGKACGDWHPMKGPMVTQTLSDLIGHEPFHWRGDRQRLSDFGRTYTGLMARRSAPTTTQFAQLRDFLASVRPLPNPWRGVDDRLPTELALAAVPGIGSPRAGAWPPANAARGLQQFRSGALAPPFQCVSCHTLPAGLGAPGGIFAGGSALASGAEGEAHLGLSSLAGLGNATFKVAPLRELWDKLDPASSATESFTGLGFGPDGSLLTLADFLRMRGFRIVSAQDEADVLAWLLAFGGHEAQAPAVGDTREPRGAPVHDTPASVGQWCWRPAGQPQPACALSLLAVAEQGLVDLWISYGSGSELRACAWDGQHCDDGQREWDLPRWQRDGAQHAMQWLALPAGMGQTWLRMERELAPAAPTP